MTGSEVPAAAVEAVVAAARGYARVAGDGEDALLLAAAGAAIALAEAFVGQALVRRPFAETVTGGTWRPLSAAPVASIDGVMAAGQALPPGAYAVDIAGDGVGLVRVAQPGTASVAYTAGLAADWDDVPAPIAHGVAMLAAHLFEAGEGAAPPAAVSALWRPYRRVRL